MGPDHLRGLALTSAVLIVIGALALVRHDNGPRDAAPRRGELVTAAGDTSGGGPEPAVPSSLLPLFPTTSSTKPTRSTSTSVTVAAGVTDPDAVSGPPASGVYTFAVNGSETLNGSSRALPSSMTLTAHRNGAANTRETVFDIRFSDQHAGRETFTFGSDAIAARHSASNITMGLWSRATNAAYVPPVAHVVLPLTAGATQRGVSEARDSSNTVLRVEEWRVTDVAARRLPIAGSNVRAWEVTLERTSRPGALEELRETRRAWFDPARRMWVHWQTTLHTRRASGGITTTYGLAYTATLTAFRPA